MAEAVDEWGGKEVVTDEWGGVAVANLPPPTLPADQEAADAIARTREQFAVPKPTLTKDDQLSAQHMSAAGQAYFQLLRRQDAIAQFVQGLRDPIGPQLPKYGPPAPKALALEPQVSEDYLTSKFGAGLQPGETATSSEQLDMQRMRLRESLGLSSDAPYVAPGPQRADSVMGNLFSSFIDLPRVKADKEASNAAHIGAGLVNVLAKNVEGAFTPGVVLSVLTGGAFPVVGRILGGVFAADMGLRAMPQYARDLSTALSKGDVQASTEAAGNWLATGLFAMGAAHAAIGKPTPTMSKEEAVAAAMAEGTRLAQLANQQAKFADQLRELQNPGIAPVSQQQALQQQFSEQLAARETAKPQAYQEQFAQQQAVRAAEQAKAQMAETAALQKAADALVAPDIELKSQESIDQFRRAQAIAKGEPYELREIMDQKTAVAERAQTLFEETAKAMEGAASQGGPGITEHINALWKAREQSLHELSQSVEDLNRSLRPDPKEFSTPEGAGWIAGTKLENWADEVLKGYTRESMLGRTRVGFDPVEEAQRLTAWTIKGVALLERGLKTKAGWFKAMLKAHGDEITPHLERVYQDSKRAVEIMNKGLEGRPMRKLSARVAGSENITPELREKVMTSPKSYYQQQNIHNIQDVLKAANDNELAQIPFQAEQEGPTNVWVAAQAEKIRRLMAQNTPEASAAAWPIMDELARRGTSMGQLINQLKLIPGVSERAMVNLLNRKLQASGYDAMSTAEDVAFKGVASQSIHDQAVFKEAERAWKLAPTPENALAVDAAHEIAVASADKLQEMVWRHQPRTFNETFRSLIQGGLLVPKSIVANVGAMVNNAGPEAGARGGAAGFDMLESFLTGRSRTTSVSPFEGAKEWWKAAIGSTSEAMEIAIKGKNSERPFPHRPLRPAKTLVDLWEGNLPKVNGKRSWKQGIYAFMEAQPSAYLAAAGLRSLGITDSPFYRGARARILTNAINTRWINMAKEARTNPALAAQLAFERTNKPRYLKYPELLFGTDELVQLEFQAAKAVYQNPNASTRLATWFEKSNPIAKGIAIFVAPYRATPSNVFGQLLSWKPPLAGLSVPYHMLKGQRAQANLAASKFLLSSMATGAAWWMYNRGLISPLMDDPSEQQKNRALGYKVMPAGHVNTTGLGRVMDALAHGKSTAGLGRWREGDETHDLVRVGGVVGANMLDVANIRRWVEKQPNDMAGADIFAGATMNAILSQANYMVNQTYLKGTATLLDAILQRKENDWLQSAVEEGTSIALPQSLNTWTRASRDYVKEIRNDEITKRLGNVIKQRLGGISGVVGKRTDEDLPNKIDLWGEPVVQTPEGQNKWLYHLLDVTGTRNIPADPTSLMIYDTWRKTQDGRVVPTPPDQNFSFAGQDYRLDREQLSQLQMAVGRARKKYLDRIVNGNREFMNKNAQAKIETIQTIYEMGAQEGSFQFWNANRNKLKLKAEPIGFEPQ